MRLAFFFLEGRGGREEKKPTVSSAMLSDLEEGREEEEVRRPSVPQCVDSVPGRKNIEQGGGRGREGRENDRNTLFQSRHKGRWEGSRGEGENHLFSALGHRKRSERRGGGDEKKAATGWRFLCLGPATKEKKSKEGGGTRKGKKGRGRMGLRLFYFHLLVVGKGRKGQARRIFLSLLGPSKKKNRGRREKKEKRNRKTTLIFYLTFGSAGANTTKG